MVIDVSQRARRPLSRVIQGGNRTDLTIVQTIVAMAVIVAIAVGVRLLGIHWLIDSGLQPDYSFHPDDNRFVAAAKSFRDYPTLGGYVLGMVSQLFIILTGAKALDIDLNALVALRGISVFHAALTMVTTYLLSMVWARDRAQAALATLFLALCPLHVINSNFGTADVSAVSLFYLTVLAGARYLKTMHQLWFTTMTALCGLALAVKFFIPMLAMLAIFIATESAGRRLSAAATAAFVLAGAFAIGSLFNYTPWDFVALMRMLIFDNVSIVDGKSPLENVALYTWRLPTALSVPLALLVTAGVAMWVVDIVATPRAKEPGGRQERWVAALRSPTALLAVPLCLHGVMIVLAGVSSTRHLLIYMPMLCVVAAATLLRLVRAVPLGRTAPIILVGLLVAYLFGNACGLQLLYRTDIRREMADWSEARALEGRRVHAVSFYTPVRGTAYDRKRDLASLRDGDILLTCDLEYERYLTSDDARRIFHAKGGQPRVDFYRNVFFGESGYKIEAVFRQRLFTPEQRLIAAGWLPMLDTFTPGLCLALSTRSTLSEAAQAAVRREAVRGTPKI